MNIAVALKLNSSPMLPDAEPRLVITLLKARCISPNKLDIDVGVLNGWLVVVGSIARSRLSIRGSII